MHVEDYVHPADVIIIDADYIFVRGNIIISAEIRYNVRSQLRQSPLHATSALGNVSQKKRPQQNVRVPP